MLLQRQSSDANLVMHAVVGFGCNAQYVLDLLLVRRLTPDELALIRCNLMLHPSKEDLSVHKPPEDTDADADAVPDTNSH